MKLSVNPILRNLNDCGCCEGLHTQMSVEITNRPGLTAIAYRSGTHAQFKKAMLAHLSSKSSALIGLTTRDDDDFTIALLDAWAIVADVLTFYQERIANESYLRTAMERVSISNLARLIGYELRPGVAASTYLAFIVEQTPRALPVISGLSAVSNVRDRTTIESGTRVQSIPGPGEQPQIFETVERIEARAAWNDIKPRLTMRHPLSSTSERLIFEGTSTNLKPGDGVLFKVDDSGADIFGLVAEVKPVPERQCTEVVLQLLSTSAIYSKMPAIDMQPRALDPITNRYVDRIMPAADLLAEAKINRFNVQDIFDNLEACPQPPPRVLVFRNRESILGHNAPAFESLPYNMREGELVYTKSDKTINQDIIDGPFKQYQDLWADKSIAVFTHYSDNYNSANNIYLDNVYSNIAINSYVVLKDANNWGIYQIKAITDLSKSVFTITAKVTRLTLNSNEKFDQFGIRTTTVFAQSEYLALARVQVEEPFPPDMAKPIELNGWVDGLLVGQSIIVTGELEGMRGIRASEYAVIDKVEHVLTREGHTQIMLKNALQNRYIRSTVSINANIALATHGETVNEVLGSGDGDQIYQYFTLRQPPLTYLSAPTPGGVESTLKVYVNDILWHNVPTLYGHESNERIYVIRIDDGGKTTIQFGDGITGARLPTGQDNIRATYRKGIGLGGLVKKEQLKLLMTRPLGIKDVTNPLDANGAADKESLDDARRNASLRTLTIDRIVSVQDYEDFARSYAGIAKAMATWTWDGRKRGIFITVAGQGGARISPDSDLYRNLLISMQKAGDPSVPLRIDSYTQVLFRLSASIKIDPDHQSEEVIDSVKEALQTNFSFEARSFGQPVALSEIIGIMHAVPGVKAVDIDELYRSDGKGGDGLKQPLPSAVPQAGADFKVLPAELLTLDMVYMNLKVMP